MLEGLYPEIKKSIDRMNEFTLTFINEKKLSLCIATASDEKEEEQYYQNIYGAKAAIINFDREAMSTYFAIDKSEIVLTFCSTVGYEAFGWGKKVLFCNFSKDAGRDFPIAGAWAMNSDNYSDFKQKLECLLQMDNAEFRRLSGAAAKHVMNYDFAMPVHVYLRQIIAKRLHSYQELYRG